MLITQKRLKQLITYDPDAGIFRARVRHRARRVGDVLGKVDGRYIRFMMDGQLYLAHRLAWLYVYGKWPQKWMDHINRDVLDNRISNLREATPSQNSINARGRANTTGFKGVTVHKKAKTVMYQARVGKVYCGIFSTPQEAHAAYREKAKQLYGEFADASS